MLDALREFLTRRREAGPPSASPSPQNEVQLAASALLLELAYADGEFTALERQYLEAALGRHFSLEAATVADLIALAERERRRSIDHFQFTRVIREQLDLGQRTVLAEVMWGVVLADGRVGDHEAYMLRKLGHLLDLEPGYLADARRRAASHRTSEAGDRCCYCEDERRCHRSILRQLLQAPGALVTPLTPPVGLDQPGPD